MTSRVIAVLVWLGVYLSCFYNLPYYPTIWWDEAIFAETAANLAETGRYALTVEGPDKLKDFDYRISVGPTLILPVALAYRLWGISVASGRVVAGGFLFSTFFLLYLAARQFFPRGPALLTVLLVLLTTDVLYWGRSVMGDIPALALFLANLLCTFRALATQSLRLWAGAGLCLGLAICAKEFYGLAVLPVLIPLLQTARRSWGQLLRQGLALGIGLALPLGAYVILKAMFLGGVVAALRHFYIQKRLLCHEFFTPLTSGHLYGESLAFLVTHPLWLTGVVGAWLWRRSFRATPGWHLWQLQLALWSLFYLLAVYWQRFALPALVLASPWAAFLLWRLADLSARPWKSPTPQSWLRWGLVCGLVLFLFPLPGAGSWQEIWQRRTDSPYKLAELLQNQIPDWLRIETPEYEVVFFDKEHRVHLMPEFYFVAADRHRIVVQSPDCNYYDFLQVRADLLILGSFGKSVFKDNYPEAVVQQHYRKIASIDYYDLYLRRDFPTQLQVRLP